MMSRVKRRDTLAGGEQVCGTASSQRGQREEERKQNKRRQASTKLENNVKNENKRKETRDIG